MYVICINNCTNALVILSYSKGLAFYSFLGFTMLQTSFALAAHSSAMIADSEAMFVDAGTYLCNMLAERLKNRDFTEAELLMDAKERAHGRKLQRLYLELVPPLISCMTLLVVTFTTMRDSLVTLFFLKEPHEEDPDLNIMLLFSGLNLILDVVNVFFFAQANQAIVTPIDFDKQLQQPASESTPLMKRKDTASFADTNDTTCDLESNRSDADYDDISDDGAVNLNMCSAWTHVFADTLRSVAVLCAAGLATVSNVISADEADAGAALVVSIVILLSCVPLLQGMYFTAKEIREMQALRQQQTSLIMAV